jgi:hypothetical protein
MADVFKGLKYFTQACQLVGVIPQFPYEEEEALVYEQRFSLFQQI